MVSFFEQLVAVYRHLQETGKEIRAFYLQLLLVRPAFAV